MIDIRNEDCFDTMQTMPTVDIILTSPPYNTNKKAGKTRTLITSHAAAHYVRYDAFVDNLTNEEYIDFTKKLFENFDKVLKSNGCILFNINYGAENTEGMFRAINTILTETPFTIADVIAWKKKSAMPNNVSKNRLTRVWEFVFVFCRKNEAYTFHCNKQVKSYRKSGQACYENIPNMVEAKNNDGVCDFNKATYSSELCEKLLALYARPNSVVYDPFMGSGTTAVACQNMGLDCIGSEISQAQVEYARNRLRSKWLDNLLEGGRNEDRRETTQEARSVESDAGRNGDGVPM